MRIDKFLWFARLTKTRAQAADMAQSGHLRIDGRRIERAHAPVAPDQILTMHGPSRVRVLKVMSLPTRRGPSVEARTCYHDLDVDAPRTQI